MAGECALPLNSGSNEIIPGSLDTNTYKLAKYADQDTLNSVVIVIINVSCIEMFKPTPLHFIFIYVSGSWNCLTF